MARFALATLFSSLCSAQTFELVDYAKVDNNNNQYRLHVSWKNQNSPHQRIISLTNTQNKLHNEFCEFDTDSSPSSCLVILPDGEWKVDDSIGDRKIEVSSEAGENLNERRSKNKVNSPQTRNLNSEWLPKVNSLNPTKPSAGSPGQRFELFGENLFPKHSDPIAGKMIEIYFTKLSTGSGDQHLCEINAYWSNNDRLICLTPNLEAGTYYMKVKYFDDATKSMVEAQRFNPSFYGVSSVQFQDKSNDAKIYGFYNRFVSGMDDGDHSYKTEWIKHVNEASNLPRSFAQLYYGQCAYIRQRTAFGSALRERQILKISIFGR